MRCWRRGVRELLFHRVPGVNYKTTGESAASRQCNAYLGLFISDPIPVFVIPSKGQPRTHPARFWLDALAGPSRGTCCSAVQGQRETRQQQVLRLRARPTRKISGSEKPRGRFAQDDKRKGGRTCAQDDKNKGRSDRSLFHELCQRRAGAKARFSKHWSVAGLKARASTTTADPREMRSNVKPEISPHH